MAAKRHPQGRVVRMILSETFDDPVPAISLGGARPDGQVVRIFELWGREFMGSRSVSENL
jgi:hypothetical protein